MEELLKKILSQDPNLLTRRDELIKILDEQVPGKLAREYNSIKRALMLNIGEIFATGNNDREAAISKATEILAQSGLQENRVKSVIDTFIKVLDWDKEPAQVEETETVEDAAPAWMDAAEEAPHATQTVEEIFKKETPPPAPPKNITPPPPVNPPPTPPTNFSNSTPAPQTSNTSKFIIAGLVVVILFLIVGKGDDNSTSEKNSTTQQETYIEEKTASEPTPAPQPQKPALVASSELSLNGVDIGLPFDTVWDYFGTPDSIKNENGYERYYYSDIEVVFKSGYLNAFVTRSPKYKTARGISVGSSYSEVVDRYGRNSADMEHNGLILHEYNFNSIRGESGLLRFAVNSSNRVEYISIRIIEPEPVAQTRNKIPANVEQAARAFLLYHQSITNGNFSQAYDLMTYDRLQIMGDYETFKKGYRNTISSEITELDIVSNDGNSVTFSYTLESRDRANGGRTLYRTFVGEVQMVKSGGDWKINHVQSSKTGESLR